VDVVAVIGRHVELKKSGRTWTGCCVFHGERTPSFHVYPEDKHFKCYGCGEYGDVFKFLQKLQGKEFRDVVQELAAEVGVEIPAEEQESGEAKERRRERNELNAALDAAARYFAARLWSRHGASGREYLEARGVREETTKLFRLGLASGEWSDLTARLAGKGVGAEALRKAGLIVDKGSGKSYDRFRGRLVFPIIGLDGQVIGFGGRMLGEEKGAKYINTPETLIYKKSRILYGIDLAREAIRKTRTAVLVEGYFDVIGLHQVGVKNAVAVCGTALTPEHVELLKRCDCREVTVLFDGDPAGLAAPGRAAQALLPSGLAGKVAVLPSQAGKIDPDDYARQNGREGVEKLLGRAAPLTDFLIDRALSSVGETADSFEGKLAALREMEPFVRLLPEGLARSVLEERIAKRLGLDIAALRSELGRAPDKRGTRTPTSPERSAKGQPRRGARIRVLLPGPAVDALGLLIAFPDLATLAAEEDLPQLLPVGPLSELARDLVRDPFRTEEALERLAIVADEVVLVRIRQLTRSAPSGENNEREFRKAAIKARLALVESQCDDIDAQVTRAGTPAPEELVSRKLALYNRHRDLKKLLRTLEQG
jgi:DNA primase